MARLEQFLIAFGNAAWGPWLVVLLWGGGLYFLIYSRFVPFRYFRHAIDVLRGKYDDEEDVGDISHFQALSSALAGTIGLGNIGGVAVAIQAGGPGAIFWMWVGAVVGTATKFFTCTLAVLYRGPDSRGDPQGGPMYTIVNGLGEKWRPLAVMFSFCALFGPLPLFQINQITQALRDVILIPNGWLDEGSPDEFRFNLACGIVVAFVAALVIIGGIRRIGLVASRIVPSMVVLYALTAVYILLNRIDEVPGYLSLIITDAFTGEAVAGGSVGWVILTGIRRSAFSNEAGLGTEALAHGAAKTDEPVREGLVAMLGPMIDTIIVCTATALVILTSTQWRTTEANGVTLTANALAENLPVMGPYIITACVFFFGISTMFAFAYYGSKSLGFLIGAHRQHYYSYFYVATIVLGAVISLRAVIGLIDGMYALMAVPTMTSTILLAPKVMREARRYFWDLKHGSIDRENVDSER